MIYPGRHRFPPGSWCRSPAAVLSVDRFELAHCSSRTTAGVVALGETRPLCYLTGMPPRVMSSADLNAAIERVTPDVLALLADGMPRTEAEIIAALADRHSKHDVTLTVMRLAVLGRVAESGGKYALANAGQG